MDYSNVDNKGPEVLYNITKKGRNNFKNGKIEKPINQREGYYIRGGLKGKK